MKRKICVVTGTRAEYGLLKPILSEINHNPNLTLSLIVAGMHLSKEFGYSLDEIKKDGFKVDYLVKMNVKEDNGAGMALSISEGIQGRKGDFLIQKNLSQV